MIFNDYFMSVAVGVGFISLADLKQSIMEGSVERVRPILMTVTTDVIGLLPILFGTSTRIRVMKRIATPIAGGHISSAIITLILLSVIYYL